MVVGRRFVRIALSTFVAIGAGLGARLASATVLKVACTGTSAMAGLGSSTGHHVPDEMGRDLGAGFEVKNFAVEGATAIKSISSSYASTSEMKAALAYNPDIVLFWFGGNDSFKGTWDAHKGEFQADYTSLVTAFQSLPSHPKTFLVRLWVFVNTPVQQTVIDKEILPIIDQIGADTNSVLIDYRKAFETHPEYFPDGMHPNDAGTLAIGKFFADSITAALSAAAADAGTEVDGAPDGGASSADGGASSADVAMSETSPGSVTSATGGAGSDAAGAAGAGGGPPPSTGSGGSGSGTTSVNGAKSSGGCSIIDQTVSGPATLSLMLLIGLAALLRRARRA